MGRACAVKFCQGAEHFSSGCPYLCGFGLVLSPLAFVLPVTWLALIWVLRPRSAPERTARFANSDENRALLARSLTYELGQLESTEAAGHYLLCRLQCPSEAVAQHICTLLAHLPQHSEPSINPLATRRSASCASALPALPSPPWMNWWSRSISAPGAISPSYPQYLFCEIKFMSLSSTSPLSSLEGFICTPMSAV